MGAAAQQRQLQTESSRLIIDRSPVQVRHGPPHGSPYQVASIWNQYGNYGGRYSTYSPCNSYSQTPPVVVSRGGDFYGYLTVNRYKNQRIPTVQFWIGWRTRSATSLKIPSKKLR